MTHIFLLLKFVSEKNFQTSLLNFVLFRREEWLSLKFAIDRYGPAYGKILCVCPMVTNVRVNSTSTYCYRGNQEYPNSKSLQANFTTHCFIYCMQLLLIFFLHQPDEVSRVDMTLPFPGHGSLESQRSYPCG